ncbi:MAG TPA: anti-sigma factor [Pyrinomonadaceae bacterium]|jgi:anti-sigma-K factor RskA
MSQQSDDLLIDLLEKRAVYGLTAEEQRQLDELGGSDDLSFDRAAAAINLVELGAIDEMPANLRARLVADANDFFAAQPAVPTPIETTEPARSGLGLFGWLGWATAAAAVLALVLNLWLTRAVPPAEIAGPLATPTPAETPGPEQMRQRLLSSATDLARADIGAGNVKDIKPTGDIVWSDAKQAGYMHVTGLPKNDPSREQYQLWIFDENQDAKTPVDGGVFDVAADGTVTVPINAKLKVRDPKMFAITIEKPGGVVVSKQEKVASLAKRET